MRRYYIEVNELDKITNTVVIDIDTYDDELNKILSTLKTIYPDPLFVITVKERFTEWRDVIWE